VNVMLKIGAGACERKSVPLRRAGCKGKGESSYSFLISALDGVSGQRLIPADLFPRGKDARYPLDPEAGWASELVWTQRIKENHLPLPAI
jgi:hypothetical protein